MDFFTFSDPNVRLVTLGAMLLGGSAAIVGCFTFVRKRALVGDAIAHSILPGVCLAFLLSGEKHPLILLSGAVLSGWISLLVMDFMVNRSKLKTDTAIGAVLSVFFGLGILMLTAIQQSGSGNQAGLDKFLFGKAASMTGQDVLTFGGVAAMLLLIVLAFYKEFKLVAFDADFARTIGLPVRLLEFILATITVLSVATGIQAVGVVLMAALLITPAAAARFWTDRISRMILLAALFGVASGLFGAFVSYTAPSMPTGPWIVMLLSAIALISIFMAPQRGILARTQLRHANRRKILTENILKAFYKLHEQQTDEQQAYEFQQIQQQRAFQGWRLRLGLQRLRRRGLVKATDNHHWQLTPEGVAESRRVVRLHRLWELYLTRRMRMAPDHVHQTAEAIEHVITPEIERQLLEELDHPQLDPHQRQIPYSIPQSDQPA